MKIKTKLGLSAAFLLIAAGSVTTMQDNQDRHAVQYMGSWRPAALKAVTVQWGVKGGIRAANGAHPPVDRTGVAQRGDVAFTFIQLPPGNLPSDFWCSVSAHGQTKTVQAQGLECYVAMPI